MSIKQQKTLIQVPKNLTKNQREALAVEIINHIKTRSKRGLDINNKPFKRYAASYVNDKDFKIAGKRKNSVNLTFTGETLNEIELLKHGAGFISIGFDGGDVNEKASFISDKGRQFLGINEKDKNKLINKLPKSDSPKIKQIVEVKSLTQRILDRLRGN